MSYFLHLFVYVLNSCHGLQGDIKGQLEEVGPHLLQCRFRNQTQGTKLGGKYLYLLSHLAEPQVDFTAYSLTSQNFEMTLGTHSLADDVTIWTGLTVHNCTMYVSVNSSICF